jgi:DNA-binding GntR family transcriptional regulator
VKISTIRPDADSRMPPVHFSGQRRGVRTAVVDIRVIRKPATLGRLTQIVNDPWIVNNIQSLSMTVATDPVESAGRSSPRRQRVLDALREAILVGRYADGDRLIEDRIAQELKTSRGPVREALRELEHEGLVVSFPYRGAVVLGVSEEEVHEVLIPIRLTLERFSFTKAAERMEEADFAELAKEVWLMGEAGRAGDLLRVVEADIRFHEFVLSCSGQPHTTQVWHCIAPRIRAYFFRYGRQSDLTVIGREHAQLLEALRSRDSKTMLRAVEKHIAVRPPAGVEA